MVQRGVNIISWIHQTANSTCKNPCFRGPEKKILMTLIKELAPQSNISEQRERKPTKSQCPVFLSKWHDQLLEASWTRAFHRVNSLCDCRHLVKQPITLISLWGEFKLFAHCLSGFHQESRLCSQCVNLHGLLSWLLRSYLFPWNWKLPKFGILLVGAKPSK